MREVTEAAADCPPRRRHRLCKASPRPMSGDLVEVGALQSLQNAGLGQACLPAN